MPRKGWFYILFFAGLFLAFYLVLSWIIPGFNTTKLPVISDVRPFAFVNQQDKTITNKDVEGKVYVAEFFFTTCKGICPIMNRNLKQVYEKFRDDPDFRILSHTVDPETDSVGRMKKYADSLGIDPSKWWFLTGRKDSLYHTARISYLLDDPKNNNVSLDQQFIHTQFFALVDKNGQVRKIYDGLKKDDLNELGQDIKALLKEKANPNRFTNALFTNNPG
ncbi:MAG TPA: SCO family protein [Puia sp.]|nr:SCO family protein [Puia sp.]